MSVLRTYVKNAESTVPARVQAAQDYLRYANGIRNPSASLLNGNPAEPADLTQQEIAVYNSALNVLSLYFSGEMDYGDVAPLNVVADDDDQQPELIPVA